LLEVAPEVAQSLSSLKIPCRVIGEVISDPRLELAEGGKVVWRQQISRLEASWSRTFREVLE
jgi:hypothetical protein